MLACLAGAAAAPSTVTAAQDTQPAAAAASGAPTPACRRSRRMASRAIAAVPAVVVRSFRFEGNTAFSRAQLLQAPVTVEQAGDKLEVRTRVRDYIGKSVTTEGLEEIRQALTRLYVGAGYINSGAVLPDQTVDGGVVLYRLVEGKLTDVNLTYIDPRDPTRQVKGRLRPKYVISRVRRGARRRSTSSAFATSSR